MKKWITKNEYKIYQVLSGRSNSYLISSNSLNILVDTGKSSAYKQLVKNIHCLGLPKKSENILVLTHAHFDHCQNAKTLSMDHHYKILLSQKEEHFALAGRTPVPSGTNSFSRLIVGIRRRISFPRLNFDAFQPDVLIQNEYDFKYCNLPIRIIITPGHSVGSVSILVDDEIAIVGDAMFGVFRNSAFPPFANDVQELIRSWGKLLQTRCQLFLPGHGNPVSRELLIHEFEKYSEKFQIKE